MEYSKLDMRKFHNYELPEEKLEEFEQQIKNKEMAESFENFKLSEQVSTELFTPGYLDFVNRKKGEISKGLPQMNKKTKIFSLRKILGIAASICLIIASILVFPQLNKNKAGNDFAGKSVAELVSHSAIASLNLDHLGTIERGDNTTINPVIELYKKEKYALVIEAVGREEPSKMLQLIEARSFMHLGEYEEAIRLLEGLNTKSFPQRDALLWSLVETELAFENKGNVNKYLQEIIQNKYPNYEQANYVLTNF